MLMRCNVAKQLNAVMGTTVFTAWNLGMIPREDLREIQLSLQWLTDLRSDNE